MLVESILKKFDQRFNQCFESRMALRLGLSLENIDRSLIDSFFGLMHEGKCDYNLFNRALALDDQDDRKLISTLSTFCSGTLILLLFGCKKY